MKQQQMNVYARFIAEDAPLEAAPAEVGKTRRAPRRPTTGSPRSPKQGLKKRLALPK